MIADQTTTIGMLRAQLFAGIADSTALASVPLARLDALKDDAVELMAEVCKAHQARRTRPRGKAKLRLVAADGLTMVDEKELAAIRRRKPIHVKGAAS